MNPGLVIQFLACSAFCLAAATVIPAVGGPFTPGNLVVSTRNTLREYTPSGAHIQSISIPYPGDNCPGCGGARDVVIGSNGHAYVYNGTFQPFLSEYDPFSNTWSHRSFAGLSLVGNVKYGGLAKAGRYVFMADMQTVPPGGPDGIVRFDLEGGPTIRFADNIEPFDLNIGLDGRLYALYPGGSPGGSHVDVFDPSTLSFIRTIEVGRNFHSGVAVDANGSLFLSSYENLSFYHLDRNGNFLSRLPLSEYLSLDVDITPEGKIAFGNQDGVVTLTDRNFESMTTFIVGDNIVNVSFVPVPEPGEMALAALTLLVLARKRRTSVGLDSRPILACRVWQTRRF